MITAYEWAFIGIRLLALYIAFHTLTILSSALPFVFSSLMQPSSINHQVLLSAIVSLMTLVLAILYPILLWIFSRKLATRLSDSATLVQIHDNTKNILSMLISIIGLIIITITLPDLIAWIFAMLSQAPDYGNQFSQMLLSTLDRPLGMLLKILFGIFLLIKAKGIAKWIHKLKYAI